MELNLTIVTLVVIIIIVWILLETKKFRHKITEVFIIFMILFTYFSFAFVLNGKSLDLSTWQGIRGAGTIYFSWLGSIFSNLKVLTANAIHMNWGIGSSAGNVSLINLTSTSP